MSTHTGSGSAKRTDRSKLGVKDERQLQEQMRVEQPKLTCCRSWVLGDFRSRDRQQATAHCHGSRTTACRSTCSISQVAGLIEITTPTPSLTFWEILGTDASRRPHSGTDFRASIITRLQQLHGSRTFIQRFFHAVSAEPQANTLGAVITNWVRATRSAARATTGL